MPAPTALEEIQSRVIGVVPAEGSEGAGFIVYEGDSRTGSFSEFLPSGVVMLANANASEHLKRAPHPIAGRGTIVWESSFRADPNNPFEKLPELVAEIEKALASLKTSQEKAPRAVIYCDGRLPLPDILALLHGLRNEKGVVGTPGKSCKACGQARKESDWVCQHCGDARWEIIISSAAGGLGAIVGFGFVVGEALLDGKPKTWEEIGTLLGVWAAFSAVGGLCLWFSVREFKAAQALKKRRGAAQEHPRAH